MKNTESTIIATPNEDGTLSALGSTWVRQEPKTGIEIGTGYWYWNYDEWLDAFWENDSIDRFFRANDLIAWTEADKPRIENRQKAMLAAEEWFDANGRFEPDWENTSEHKWFLWTDGEVAGLFKSYPIGVRYFFKTEAEAKKFVADMGEHLKWL